MDAQDHVSWGSRSRQANPRLRCDSLVQNKDKMRERELKKKTKRTCSHKFIQENILSS